MAVEVADLENIRVAIQERFVCDPRIPPESRIFVYGAQDVLNEFLLQVNAAQLLPSRVDAYPLP